MFRNRIMREIPVQNLRLLTMVNANEAVNIADDDMIHIRWKHVTLRLNVTGLIYLVDFLNGSGSRSRQLSSFDLFGSPDDGYQLWIQDVGLRLSPDDFRRFRRLLDEALVALKGMGKHGSAHHLPDCLKLTAEAVPSGSFSEN